jgi:hypothetical protein
MRRVSANVASVIEAWDRQPGEGTKAWVAFCVYRDLDPATRSLSKVAQELGKSKVLMGRWSSHWRWVGRVRAWESEKDRQKRAGELKALEDMDRRQVAMGRLMQSKGIERLNAMSPDEVQLLSVSEVIRLIETGVRLERIGRGDPDVSEPLRLVIDERPPIIEFLRQNPQRIGPVVEALAALRAAVPELAQPERTRLVADVEESRSSA